MLRSYRVFSICVAIIPLVALARAQAAEKPTTKPLARSVALFDGMQSGDLDVRFVAKNDQEAQLIVKNTTKQPLDVSLPDAFAAMPVLAQIGGGGFGGGGNRGGGGGGSQTQSVGGGGGLGGGGGGLGGGGFNVPPETTTKIKLPVVCLEHGKADPNPRITYEIHPLEDFSKDPRLHQLMRMFGAGQLNHRAAQAAAWHFSNSMDWSALAAKKIDHVGRPDEPYFSATEMQLAARIAAEAERLASQDTSERQTQPKFDSSNDY